MVEQLVKVDVVMEDVVIIDVVMVDVVIVDMVIVKGFNGGCEDLVMVVMMI